MKTLLLVLLLSASAFAQTQPVPSEWTLPNVDTAVVSEVVPHDTAGAKAKFTFVFGKFPNAFTSNKNYTYGFGINVAPGGGVLVAGEPAVYWGFESRFETSATTDQTEVHLNIVDRSGVTRRAFFAGGDSDTGGSNVIITANAFTVISDNKVPFQAIGNLILLNDGAYFRKIQNNTPFWQNMSAAGTQMLNVVYLDGNDRAKFGVPVDSKDAVYVNGSKRLGSQCLAIANADDKKEGDDHRAINEILSCLRSHGLVAN